MAQARWNGVDGMDERTRAPYWRIGVRHALADAARGYDWSRVLRVLTEHPDCVNASRPGGRARYAPLHQAAHGGAPASVVRRLLDLGAWRTLRTRGGERPVDIARRRGNSRVIPMLMPAYRRRRVPLDDLRRMQRHFHAVIREHPPSRRPCLRLPEIEPLLEMGRERVYFEVPGMFGGFEYWLEPCKSAHALPASSSPSVSPASVKSARSTSTARRSRRGDARNSLTNSAIFLHQHAHRL